MSKRQRRRVTKRRSMHVEHVKRRSVLDPRLPIALAVVAAPAAVAPAAQASPATHHLDAAALGSTGALPTTPPVPGLELCTSRARSERIARVGPCRARSQD